MEIHYIFYRNETHCCQNRDEHISARIGWSNSKYSKYPPFRFRKYRSKSNSSAENRRFGNFTLATSVDWNNWRNNSTPSSSNQPRSSWRAARIFSYYVRIRASPRSLNCQRKASSGNSPIKSVMSEMCVTLNSRISPLTSLENEFLSGDTRGGI